MSADGGHQLREAATASAGFTYACFRGDDIHRPVHTWWSLIISKPSLEASTRCCDVLPRLRADLLPERSQDRASSTATRPGDSRSRLQ